MSREHSEVAQVRPMHISEFYLWADPRIQALPTELWQTVAQLCVTEFRHGLRGGWQPPLSTMAQMFDEEIDKLRSKLRQLDSRGLIEHEGNRWRVADWVMFKCELPSYRRMRYGDYLRTRHWKNRRLRAIKRAGFQCERCGRQGTASTLHVHHKTYKHLGYEHDEDLEALCIACHREEHAEKINQAKTALYIGR